MYNDSYFIITASEVILLQKEKHPVISEETWVAPGADFAIFALHVIIKGNCKHIFPREW